MASAKSLAVLAQWVASKSSTKVVHRRGLTPALSFVTLTSGGSPFGYWSSRRIQQSQDPRETVTQEVVWVALHEIGHVIEGSFMPGKTTTQKLGGYRRLSDGKRSTRGNLYSNTFREALTNVMDAAAGVRGKAYTKEEAEAILNEIVNPQRYGSADIPNPNTGEIVEPVRRFRL